jgi:hypothetical protein
MVVRQLDPDYHSLVVAAKWVANTGSI